MEPLTLLAWVGVTALSIVIAATAVYTVWALIQHMRGKTTDKPSRTPILHGRG